MIVDRDIRKILIDKGVVPSTNITVGGEIAESDGAPADLVSVRDTGEASSSGGINTAFAYDNVNAQVRVRNRHYDVGEALIMNIHRTLLGIGRTVVNGNVITGIYAAGGVTYLEKDENDRYIFVANFRIAKSTRKASELGNRVAT